MPEAVEELLAYETDDEVVYSCLGKAFSLLVQSAPPDAFDRLRLALFDPDHASDTLRKSEFATTNCQALLQWDLIVVNERFVRELEAALRSFAKADSFAGCPYSRDDPSMFALVRRLQTSPDSQLARLRRRATRATADPEAETRVREELTLTLLFFLGHEVGHLASGHASGGFASFVDPTLPLEERLDWAVVKLCRHVDEFAPTQFDLPGFEQAADRTSEVRRKQQRYTQGDDQRARFFRRQEVFFENEKQADDWANIVISRHLRSVAEEEGDLAADRTLFLLARGLYAASLYVWYVDLQIFAGKLSGHEIRSSKELTLDLSRDRSQYIHAASLFGENHRFTLLRAALALEEAVRCRSDFFDRPSEKRRIHSELDSRSLREQPDRVQEWWLSETLQRYYLLCISMDTAVKIANVGCATSWMLEADEKRGTPQLLLMNYEPIEAARERLSWMS